MINILSIFRKKTVLGDMPTYESFKFRVFKNKHKLNNYNVILMLDVYSKKVEMKIKVSAYSRSDAFNKATEIAHSKISTTPLKAYKN